MNTEKNLRERLTELYLNNPYIHISVSLTKPHIELSGVRVKLVGAYAHIFQVEEEVNGRKNRYSMQYGDIIAGIVKIAEIE